MSMGGDASSLAIIHLSTMGRLASFQLMHHAAKAMHGSGHHLIVRVMKLPRKLDSDISLPKIALMLMELNRYERGNVERSNCATPN